MALRSIKMSINKWCRELVLSLVAVCLSMALYANDDVVFVESDSLLLRGQTNYSSSFFRDYILHNTMGSFLSNYNDYLTYQAEAVGDFNVPDQNVISVQGNSFRWAKYYLDGFRIDSRITPGDALYDFDLYSTALNFDVYNSTFQYQRDKEAPNAVSLRYNHGNVGDYTPWTQYLFTHPTALETVFRPIDYRKHTTGAGVLNFDYTIKTAKDTLRQHLYIDFGQRELTAIDYEARTSPYYEDYVKVEMMGDLPWSSNKIFDRLSYALGYSQRDQMFHQFYYGENETGEESRANVSVFGTQKQGSSQLTSGVTFSTSKQQHNELDFARNVCDMDGESFSPYYPDAQYLELTHFLDYKKELRKDLVFKAETYNSFLYSSAASRQSINPIYYKSRVVLEDHSILPEDTISFNSFYVYDWRSKSFGTGLLENKAGLYYDYSLTPGLDVSTSVRVTLDGFLLADKSRVNPNWEVDLFLTWRPASFFSMGINASRKRIAYHYDQVKYLSNDYLNADIYFWNDVNQDQTYQANERSDYFTSTGGQYRSLADDIKQPSFYMVDIPLVFSIGRKHTFSFVTTYKKYNNLWYTWYDKPADQYGHYVSQHNEEVFYLNEGNQVNYVVSSDLHPSMQIENPSFPLPNSPSYFSNVIKYKYQSERVFLSVSWVSQYFMSPGVEGNSPIENNLELFSDANANPNTSIRQLGRPNQDRGYVAHFLYGYRFRSGLRISALWKFIDGQPFTRQTPLIYTDATTGNSQFSSVNFTYKGDTPYDTQFGYREDFIANTELRIAYPFNIKSSVVELNASVYNLFDFAGELNSAGYYLPGERVRNTVELQIPRGLMFTAKVFL